MERAGAAFDVERCTTAHARAAADQSALVATWEAAAPGVNPASTKQVAEFLYTTKKYPLPPIAGSLKAIKKRDEEAEPTSEAALDWLWRKAQNPANKALLRNLLDLKKVTKYAQFLERLPEFVSGGRIYAGFGPDTGTGRLSSRNPNLQNIPSGDPYGIRSCFVAPAGKQLLVADFAALEPRILAHYLIALFGDHTLAEAIASGDLYSAIAIRTWPTELAGITPSQLKEHPTKAHYRGHAKAILLGTNYGKTVSGLAVQLGLDRKHAQRLYDDYFEAYPGIREFQNWAYKQAQRGQLLTLLGRTRTFPMHDEKRAARQATNTIIQGSAADLVMAAMVAQAEVPGSRHRKLVLQIHDELVWELTDPSEAQPLVESMKHPLAVDLHIPLNVSWKLVPNWAEGK
jgi:DNA polymerase-1